MRLKSEEELNRLIAGKPCHNGYWSMKGAPEALREGRLLACCAEGATMLFEQKRTAYQLYLFLSDKVTSLHLPELDKPVMTEVITRTDCRREANLVHWLERLDMKLAQVRIHLRRTGFQPLQGKTAAGCFVKWPDDRQARQAIMLLQETLDSVLSDVPDAVEAERMLCALDQEGQVRGALHFSVDGKTSLLRHLAVPVEYRRRGIASQLMRAWLELPLGDSRRLWVLESNAPAIALYTSLGFAADGRKCYSFLYEP